MIFTECFTAGEIVDIKRLLFGVLDKIEIKLSEN